MSSLVHSRRTAVVRDLILSVGARERVLAALLVALALFTRFYQVAANGLRTDEMYSVWMASQGIPTFVRAIVIEGHDATPPTYYVLLNLAMQISWDLWAIRLVSIVAGALTVWVTYLLARHLFDQQVAALSSLLVALSPFSIEVSQVARAYALTSLLVLASLYYFVRLNRPVTQPRTVWLFAFFTLASISTHYLAGVMVVFYNLAVAVLALTRHLPRRKFLGWIQLQALMGLVSLPLLWMALQRAAPSEPGTGQSWLPAPSLAGMIKSIILWGTGDPTYGGTGFSVARLLALLLVCGLLAAGALMAWRLWHTRFERRLEVRQLALVAAALFVPWLLALAVSLQRKIFHEKYFAFLAPLLLILLAWSVLRLRPLLVGRAALVGLLGITGLALAVYYTAPNGEQWREAMAYVRAESQPGDYVVTTPGYYVRQMSYYLTGNMAPYDYDLARAPLAVAGPDGLQAARTALDSEAVPVVTDVVRPAQRVWLVTGYAAVDPIQLNWFYDRYAIVAEERFLGVRVVLGTLRSAEPAGEAP